MWRFVCPRINSMDPETMDHTCYPLKIYILNMYKYHDGNSYEYFQVPTVFICKANTHIYEIMNPKFLTQPNGEEYFPNFTDFKIVGSRN